MGFFFFLSCDCNILITYGKKVRNLIRSCLKDIGNCIVNSGGLLILRGYYHFEKAMSTIF